VKFEVSSEMLVSWIEDPEDEENLPTGKQFKESAKVVLEDIALEMKEKVEEIQ
jgi:hypothetical protein